MGTLVKRIKEIRLPNDIPVKMEIITDFKEIPERYHNTVLRLILNI